MGKERVRRLAKIQVVLDTNVFVSAILFYGLPSQLVPLWQRGNIQFLISAEVLNEYIRVLAYPKFHLGRGEVRLIIEQELMPFIKPVKIKTNCHVIEKDPSDNKFLSLAVDGKADYIISSDKHLLKLHDFQGIEILTIEEFFRRLKDKDK